MHRAAPFQRFGIAQTGLGTSPRLRHGQPCHLQLRSAADLFAFYSLARQQDQRQEYRLMSMVAGPFYGPYAVEGMIGSGAMGIVYRARHRATHEVFALKTLRTRAPGVLAAFRREIQILAKLRHPNIARILDQGVTHGAPWFTMELVDGTSLRSRLRPRQGGTQVSGTEHCEALRTLADADAFAPLARLATTESSAIRLSPDELVRLAIPICQGLAFLHGRGVVHRDLKPENILIRNDGEPVLVDFGLVFPFGGMGRETLELVDAGSGTFAYMAPEQRRERFVDARADLFSLGCILYESLTGALPYGLVGVHELAPDPLPPSALAPEIPVALDTLVMHLLTRNPQDRIGYADDVVALLRSWGGQDVQPSAETRTTYLYRSHFVGRRKTYDQLSQSLETATGGRGAKVFVTAASGAGKTRLVLEVAAMASERGMTVITGECLPVGTAGGDRALSAPLHPIRRLLTAVADFCRAASGATAQKLLYGRARLLSPYERSLAELAEQVGDPEPLPLLDDAARARMLSALAALVLDFARERPLLFVVDDLQWADELSLDLLSFMTAQDCAKAPLVLLGTCRIDEMPKRLELLVHESGTVHTQIDRMDKAELGQMVGGMLALRRPPEELVDFLYAESSGNPFFLAEYLRTAIAEGRLERNTDGRWVLSNSPLANVAVPIAISELIRRRLDGLDTESRRILDAAAVLGRNFDTELLAQTVDADLSEVLDAYGTLRQRQILEDDQTGVVRFVHDQLRDTAYSSIDADERTRWHQRAAVSIEEYYAGSELDPYLGALGFHLAKAGAPDRAAAYFERAADLARRSYANGDAVKLYRLAIAQIDATSMRSADKSRARATVHEAVGDLLLMTGDAPAAREAFDSALADSAEVQPVERGRRLRKCARTWERQHQHGKALDEFAKAEAQLGDTMLAEEHGTSWWCEWVQVQVDKTWDFYWLAKVDELSRLVERVRPVVEKHGEPSQRAQFYQALVHTALRRERYARLEEAIEFGRRSLAAAEQCDDPRELALAQFFLAFPLLCDGRLEESEPLFVAAIDVADRIGDTTLQARFLSYYAVLHRRAGRVEQTRKVAERAASIAERGAMFDYVGAAHGCLAWAAWKGGDRTEVEHHGRSCLAAWAKLLPAYDYPIQWVGRLPLAAQLVADGELDMAMEQWRALLTPTQYRLPPLLWTAMEDATSSRLSQTVLSATNVIRLATELRYL